MEIYTHLIIPLLIFLARIIDVSLGTIRVLLISKGQKLSATGLGFIEVLIWLLAIKEILNNLDSIASYIAYPAGFAAGTYIGMLLEERLINGKVVLRVIVKNKQGNITTEFKKQKIQFTTFDGNGVKRPSKLLFCVLDRKKVEEAIHIIKLHQPKAFYTIENIRYARDPLGKMHNQRKRKTKRYFFYRKGK